MLPLLAGASLALTAGCIIIPVVTRSVDFLGTFLRYQAVASPGALLAALLLALALHVLRMSQYRDVLASSGLTTLSIVVGAIVGAFAGGPGVGAIVFGLPTLTVLLGAIAGRRFFARHVRWAVWVVSVASVVAGAGLVLVARG